jgi:hypothetical protein
MNASGGYVHSVQIEKTTFRQVSGGSGVGSTASNVVTATTNFDGALSATDTTVQAALDTLDDKVGINALTEKTTPVDADMLGLMDSAASNVLKKLSWANIKAKLFDYIRTGVATAPTAGYLGEEKVVTESTGVAINTSTYVNVASVTLTAGIWEVCGVIAIPNTSSVTALQTRVDTKGVTGTLIGRDLVEVAIPSGYPYSTTCVLVPRRVEIASGDADKTVSYKAATAGANATAKGVIRAVRIA